ncbi:MAG: ComEA family DNA-binding protein [Ruminococcus sp.]|uniref:ComEA family DNA-binding protein n=1 Tax=Ruminococcus sp. TaxID=41978 RepID=UPI0025E8D7C1|nr:ComEA family DNA-binding protein [Ruminococcus sp.]MCR5599716.1 ComEA family DNA-binding protein [Ruminococcus sp.]
MKGNSTFKKYLLFMICSALIVGSVTFYFHVTDQKKRTTTIIIRNSELPATQNSSEHQTTIKVTEKSIKNTKTSSTKQSSRTTKQTTTFEIITEPLYIDINSANKDELKKLNGIGEVLASEIIFYRENNGEFRNIDEIMNVNGIGEGIFNKIKDFIYVVNPTYEEDIEDIAEDVKSEIDESVNESETEFIPSIEDIKPININTADVDTLMLLPYIDEDIAEKIIDFRGRSGGFKNEYELLLIEGLTRAKVAEIMPYITIQ